MKHDHVVIRGFDNFITVVRQSACFGCFLSTSAKREPAASHNVIDQALAFCTCLSVFVCIHLILVVVIQAQAAQLHQTI